MRKMLALVLALVLALSASLALADEFKMGIDAEYPPFSYLDDVTKPRFTRHSVLCVL